jgi:hypothetical protein
VATCIFILLARQDEGVFLPSLEVAFQNGLRLTVDFSRESWPYCWLWFQKLTILSTMVSKVDHTVDCGFKSWPYCRLTTTYGFKSWPDCRLSRFHLKKSQLVQLVDCRFFVDFAVDISSDFSRNESGRIRTKWPQNLQKIPSKSTVDYVADPRSCNSWLFSRKLTILSTMLSKVDHTVDYGFKSWPYCRLWFQKLTGLLTSKIFIQRLSTSQKKILQQSIYDEKSTIDFKACFLLSITVDSTICILRSIV